MNIKTIKKSVFFVFSIGVSILLIWLGFSTLKENYSRDLKSIHQQKGIIEHAKVVLKRTKATGKYSIYFNLKILKIKLNTTNEAFYSYNNNQNYAELTRKLKEGTTVLVYYKKLNQDEVANNVLKLISEDEVLLTHESYKSKEYFAGVIMMLLGFLLLLLSVFLLKN
ncbi:hypothetical protein [Tenacibaculum halocynthiae]|uniref:hypothetical protein n=1 Tax=Tenacibaculum halocynthiae TaxID=1254437 RepID=UPI003893EC1B